MSGDPANPDERASDDGRLVVKDGPLFADEDEPLPKDERPGSPDERPGSPDERLGSVDEASAMEGSVAPDRRLPAVHDRPWAVAVYLAFAALVGLAWSAPIAAMLARTTGEYPRGDAELFDPGAVMLLEALRRMVPAFAAIRVAWLIVALIALPLGLVALGFAVAQLAIPGKARPSWALARSVRAFPTLVIVALVTVVADVVLVLLFTIAGGAISRAMWPEPPSRDIARLALFGLIALALVAVSGLHDLASVAAVTGPSRTYISLRAALHVAWRTPGRAAWAYVWRLSAGLLALALSAAAGMAIGVRTTGAILASALVHQLGLAAAGWMRLSWLSACGRLVRPVVTALARRSGRGDPPPAAPVGEAASVSGGAPASAPETRAKSETSDEPLA